MHCDVKPDNIMCTKEGHATLIDFGLSHKYLERSGKHMEFLEAPRFKGTFLYSSKNVLEKIRHTRRDDIESLFYTLMHICNVKMPWIPDKCDDREQYLSELYKLKLSMSDMVVVKVSLALCLTFVSSAFRPASESFTGRQEV